MANENKKRALLLTGAEGGEAYVGGEADAGSGALRGAAVLAGAALGGVGVALSQNEQKLTTVAGGNVAGLQGDPPVKKSKMIRRKKFAGCEVFELDSDRYNKCKRAKLRSERFAKFVGDDEIALAIREYAKTYPAKGIMIQDSATGAMTYLKFPKGKSGVQF